MSLNWKKTDLPTLAQKKAAMASETCRSLIYAGVDVELSTGKRHFSLDTHDQTNIDAMFTAVNLGATEYPYHADGDKCILFTKEDIIRLYAACKSYVTYQTTYCNFLKLWIARETDQEVLAGIVYGSELPGDLKAEMEAILESAEAQIKGITGEAYAAE